MTSCLRTLILTSAMALALGGVATAQQDDDPLADLFNEADQSDPATPDVSDEFRPDDFENSDPAVTEDEDEGVIYPRLAPIFAPDYNEDDYVIRPETEEDNLSSEDIFASEEALPEDELTEGGEDSENAESDVEDEQPVLDFEYMRQPAVMLRGLDKITGRATDIEVGVGSSAMLGGLRVTVRACHQTPPTEAPESIAYIEVEDYGYSVEDPSELPEEVDLEQRVFNGWMFASSPGLNGLQHAVYDVWVMRCMAEAPDLSSEESPS
ncbi:DUF2155 domain-containing protein [Ponticaulis sp.]|uniref:DUF2155 domain-containing protein n=1 Tax=Ponticaulis sp. TaxID=2020902 RepID=UPI0025F40EDE|nr:DUF2155 domain-containing protein [Ponticaulis sp.]